MAALETPSVNIGWNALDFKLKATDRKFYSLNELKGENGTIVMFICNHCPFVKAIIDKIVRDARELKKHGINCIAINSNDTENYPEDSFDNMQKLSAEKAFPFVYLIDETQATAKNYDAVCTPDFFGFDKNLKLQYRGRLDDSKMNSNNPEAKRELFEAMIEISKKNSAPEKQISSIGCSIKWKETAA